MEAQRAQKALIEATNDYKELNAMTKHEWKNNTFSRAKSTRRETLINYKYCGYSHVPVRCPGYDKRCSQCDKMNCFSQYVEARPNRPPDMTIDKELFIKHHKTMKRQRL